MNTHGFRLISWLMLLAFAVAGRARPAERPAPTGSGPQLAVHSPPPEMVAPPADRPEWPADRLVGPILDNDGDGEDDLADALAVPAGPALREDESGGRLIAGRPGPRAHRPRAAARLRC